MIDSGWMDVTKNVHLDEARKQYEENIKYQAADADFSIQLELIHDERKVKSGKCCQK